MSISLRGTLPRCGGKRAGVTLVELLIAVALTAIILTVGVPSFRTLVQNSRITANTNRFLTSMMFARSEAIKRGIPAEVLTTTGNWNDGWVVWADLNGNNAYNPPAEDVRIEEALNVSLTLNSTGGNTAYRYNTDGTLNGGAADSLDLCDSSRTGETGRRLSVAASGHVTVNRAFVCP